MQKDGMDRKQYRTAKFGSWEHSLTLDAQVAAVGATAASTAKAAANAIALADCLAFAKSDVMDTLQRWEPDQLHYGEQLRILGKRLGDRSQFNE
jgi:hypothetical protein